MMHKRWSVFVSLLFISAPLPLFADVGGDYGRTPEEDATEGAITLAVTAAPLLVLGVLTTIEVIRGRTFSMGMLGPYLHYNASEVLTAQVMGGGPVFDDLCFLLHIAPDDAPRLARAMRRANPQLTAALTLDCGLTERCQQDIARRWVETLASSYEATP
jgi:hypothetical protein